MNQTELNENWVAAILYYCDQKSTGARFEIDASDVGTWLVDGNNNIQVDTWLLNTTTFPIPTVPDDFTGYDLADVQEFYLNKYDLPNQIPQNQCWLKLTATELAAVETTAALEGMIVFDTTNKRPKMFDGTSWVTL